MPATLLAPKVTGPTTKRATRPTKPLPSFLTDGSQDVPRVPFDPAKHLCFQDPAHTVTMADIGLEGRGISPVAVTDPFPLFTPEAVQQMRAEIFSPRVLAECSYTSSFSKHMVRGMGRERAPFTYAAMHSDAYLAAVSKAAGIDLVPAYDFEIANVNVAADEDFDARSAAPRADAKEDDLSAFAWHFDSFPFVCVTMLSDCTHMVGGETVVRTGTGGTLKVRGPSHGTSVVMQGRYIEHQALKAVGGRERISMVTPFRPRSPFVRDEIVLVGVRPISDVDEMYTQYTEYRLEVLAKRVEAMREKERARNGKGSFDIAAMKAFLTEQQRYIESMVEEIQEIDD